MRAVGGQQISFLRAKSYYLKVLFLGAYSLTFFEWFSLAECWGDSETYRSLSKPNSLLKIL